MLARNMGEDTPHIQYGSDFKFCTVALFFLWLFSIKNTPKVVSNFWGALQFSCSRNGMLTW